ncbi:MAG: ATP-binding protein [Pseudomonadota bacterium]
MTSRKLHKFFFGTLRGRLILGVAAVHAVMMTFFIVDLTVRQRVMLLDHQAEEAEALAQSLSTSAAGWIAAADVSGLQELVETQRLYPELVFAMLVDKQGHVFAHTDRSRLGAYLLDLPQDVRRTVISKTPALVDVAVPAILGGRHVGWARIGIGHKAASQKLESIMMSGVFYALTAILIGSLIAWFMGLRITRRLYVVQATINKVRAGDHAARSHLEGDDEATSMAREFNAMLDALSERDAALRKAHDQLEQRVMERTAQLVDSNRHLEEEIKERKMAENALKIAYTDLKSMQEHLLQSEKMATVGQLAAGVAHEINNPAGFVMSNLEMLRWYADDLKKMLEKYGDMEAYLKDAGDAQPRRLFGEIEQLRRERDIDTLLADLPDLIGESLEGMQRIKRIVMDLRSFAHFDEGVWEEADIHEIIQSALNIACNEITNKADVIKAYADVPRIRCYPQQLSRLFLNLFINAVQAISERGTITIRTFVSGETVVVEVVDTGCGLEESVRKRVFEPFFTTKPVGKGTGLGLSLAYNIVRKHHGEISVTSRPGEGSVFTIRLPKGSGYSLDSRQNKNYLK